MDTTNLRRKMNQKQALMNQPSAAFCPQCKQEVVFVKSEGKSTCPSCGFQYELTRPEPTWSAEPGSSAGFEMLGTAKTVLMVIFKTVLIMIVLAFLGLAVVFVGCALG